MFQAVSSASKRSTYVPSLRVIAMAAAVMAGSIWAQPDAPSTPDIPCSPTPDPAGQQETAAKEPDAEGFYSIFDGTSKGWWHSCQTSHSSGSPLGAIFKLATVGSEPAIYSNDRNNNIGGILMTKKKYDHYELVFDFWPDFGNDGGVFNRTPPEGKCFQTVLDYFDGASVGGTWGEGGFTSRDFRPWKYVGNENTISIPSGNSGWTFHTSRNNPTSFGCAATGCVAADYYRLWDANGWNQIRLKFYGASKPGEGTIHMQTWFRKLGSTVWVPIISDTTLNEVVPANFIGFQVHGGNRFKGQNGTWYKNIKIRELTPLGEPKPPVAVRRHSESPHSYKLKAIGNSLSGVMDAEYEISVRDVNGKTLETFRGQAGSFSHVFKSQTYGWLNLHVKTASGVKFTRILREPL